MSSSNPTLDWERCGDSFYRKTKIYDAVFDQDLELENHIVAAAPYGGAIGTWLHQRCVIHLYLTMRSLVS